MVRSGRGGLLLRLLGLLLLGLTVLAAGGGGAGGGGGEPETPRVALELVADGLGAPVALADPPGADGRLLVADQLGVVQVVEPDGTLRATPLLDLRGHPQQLAYREDERGLLGLALHPAFADNGRLFLYHSGPLQTGAPVDWSHTDRLVEYQVDPATLRADPASRRVLLAVDQPQANHNGGGLAFGPDGMLYLAIGDGGGAFDRAEGHLPGGNGQDVEGNLLGSILRLDVDLGVDGDAPYGIPPDNPFVGGPGLDEVWAFGFRNPWRVAFDLAGDGALYAGDAGQHAWEEIDLVTRGGNYGWNWWEGTHCERIDPVDNTRGECPSRDSAGRPFVPPILEYANGAQPGGLGRAVIGGAVYRGTAIPWLRGRYVFGDWSRSWGTPDGTLFLATRHFTMAGSDGSAHATWTMRELAIANRPGERLGAFLLAIGQDAAGELYLLGVERDATGNAHGVVYRLVAAGEEQGEQRQGKAPAPAVAAHSSAPRPISARMRSKVSCSSSCWG